MPVPSRQAFRILGTSCGGQHWASRGALGYTYCVRGVSRLMEQGEQRSPARIDRPHRCARTLDCAVRPSQTEHRGAASPPRPSSGSVPIPTAATCSRAWATHCVTLLTRGHDQSKTSLLEHGLKKSATRGTRVPRPYVSWNVPPNIGKLSPARDVAKRPGGRSRSGIGRCLVRACHEVAVAGRIPRIIAAVRLRRHQESKIAWRPAAGISSLFGQRIDLTQARIAC